jgi:hypothetical protein
MKKGSRVICIESDPNGFLTYGNAYIVAKHDAKFVRLEGLPRYFCKSRFKVIESKTESFNLDTLSRDEKLDLIRRIAESL